ncbi:hypothetical protein BS78_01G307200 [Paspalum vaginatum]|nr:hypothetical protein BS78_01G307200 [Paspalum vaginatum]
MASFTAQLKDRFLGLVERLTGCSGRGTCGKGNSDVPEEPAAKLPNVQPIVVRSRGPIVDGGSTAGVN